MKPCQIKLSERTYNKLYSVTLNAVLLYECTCSGRRRRSLKTQEARASQECKFGEAQVLVRPPNFLRNVIALISVQPVMLLFAIRPVLKDWIKTRQFLTVDFTSIILRGRKIFQRSKAATTVSEVGYYVRRTLEGSFRLTH